MWPKAFAQFVELAPHVSRLLPMADRFFQNKSAGEDAHRKALDTLGNNLTASGERLRADLNQIALTQAALTDQIADNSRTLARVADDAAAARLATQSTEQRLTRLEARQGRTFPFLGLLLLLLATVCALQLLLLARGR